MKHCNPTLRALVLITGLFLAAAAEAGDVVVIMAHGAPPLSKDKVANVYIGRDHELKPLDLPSGTSTRVEMYKKTTNRDEAQVKALWARIAFTGLGIPPRQLADDAAVKKAVAADPNAIGYIDKADVDGSVTVVLDLK